jgi:hypothetical protein
MLRLFKAILDMIKVWLWRRSKTDAEIDIAGLSIAEFVSKLRRDRL